MLCYQSPHHQKTPKVQEWNLLKWVDGDGDRFPYESYDNNKCGF